MAAPIRLRVDLASIEKLQIQLGAIGGDGLQARMVESVNAVTARAYTESKRRILSGINLREPYVDSRMKVQEARPGPRIEATIVAFRSSGAHRYTTTLGQYGAAQQVKPVTWSNAGIAGMGKRTGPWPGWTRRTGDEKRGIGEDYKAAGLRVEVVRGSQKGLSHGFLMPVGGRLLTMKRDRGGRMKTAYGPSVWQLFRHAIPQVIDGVQDDLQVTVLDGVEKEIQKAFE